VEEEVKAGSPSKPRGKLLQRRKSWRRPAGRFCWGTEAQRSCSCPLCEMTRRRVAGRGCFRLQDHLRMARLHVGGDSRVFGGCQMVDVRPL
jgi:hypothetical protein